MLSMEMSEQINNIQNLVESGIGDIGRLNFIKGCLENQTPLFQTDQNYLKKNF